MIETIKHWFYCPDCGLKLCRVTPNAIGVFVFCKYCKEEKEVSFKDKDLGISKRERARARA